MNENTADKAREKPAAPCRPLCFTLYECFLRDFSVGAYEMQKNRNPSSEAIL